MSAADRIIGARTRAGLSQSRLAQLAGVPQPNLSAYEAGKSEPRPETLERILKAARVRPSVLLSSAREQILRAADRRKARDVRVFGSVARGTDTASSDVDFLVTFDETASILDAAGLTLDLEDILGRRVDVMSDRAEGAVLDRALEEAVPL